MMLKPTTVANKKLGLDTSEVMVKEALSRLWTGAWTAGAETGLLALRRLALQTTWGELLNCASTGERVAYELRGASLQ